MTPADAPTLPLNVCVVGHGMMGTWHSNALAQTDCVRHTLVGRRPEPTSEFARANGFGRWTTSLAEALEDHAIDVVIVASPSQDHAESAALALTHDKHVLVEVPLGLNLAEAETIVEVAAKRGLTIGVVHPLRARPDLRALRERVAEGVERVRHVGGRLFLHRLENVGSTGYRRSWTDNILWHHMAHVVDAGAWLCGSSVAATHSVMSPIDAATGIPMDVAILANTVEGQSLVCTGSFYARERIFDLLVVTDRDSYRLDVFQNTLTTGAGSTALSSEEENCTLVTLDFLESVARGHPPLITGESVLPAMRILAAAQRQWDAEHGLVAIPGRPVDRAERQRTPTTQNV
jgi:2-hydroxy-4-carboxymuconate semialdehyde hemiacetal dehydrogenase